MERVPISIRKKRLYAITVIAIFILTLASAGSFIQETQKLQSNYIELATNTARSNFEKDIAFRVWVAEHGGLYVPENERTPANPYLEHIEDQNIQTPSGVNLTLMNPAYALRQLIEEYEASMGIIGHVTSLSPVNPANAADEWETSSLEMFELGVEEVSEVSMINEVTYLRLMKPMYTQEACLKCHGYQGYEVGDIRGGISISVPMTQYLLDESEVQSLNLRNHGILWSLGILGIVLGSRQIFTDADESEQAENRLRSFLDSMDIGLTIWDKNLIYLDMNQTVLNRFELTREELTGKSLVDIDPRISGSGRIEAYKNVIETGVSFESDDVIILTPEGERQFLVRAYKVGDGVGNMSRDITEERNTLRALQKSEELFRGFMQSATEAFIMFDKDMHYIDVNDRWLQDHPGISREEVIGKHVLEVNPVLKETGRYDAYLKVLETGESVEFNAIESAYPPNSILDVTGFKTRDGLGLISKDISERVEHERERELLYQQIVEERVKTEQEQELGRLKNQFISTATHELRTPVTSILGYLELVLSDTNHNLSDLAREDLGVVLRNANRLVTLTNDLLDVQRMTSGRFEIQRTQVDLVKLLNEVVEELTPLFTEKQQVLVVEAPSELSVLVDEVRVSQLLINLLRNANKFTPEEGKITVTVDSSEEHFVFAVKDSGIGLSEEDIDKLFKPFPGIHHGLDVSSTGLGLSICKGIVDMHNGEIWAESDGSGEGCTFNVKIPI